MDMSNHTWLTGKLSGSDNFPWETWQVFQVKFNSALYYRDSFDSRWGSTALFNGERYWVVVNAAMTPCKHLVSCTKTRLSWQLTQWCRMADRHESLSKQRTWSVTWSVEFIKHRLPEFFRPRGCRRIPWSDPSCAPSTYSSRVVSVQHAVLKQYTQQLGDLVVIAFWQ